MISIRHKGLHQRESTGDIRWDIGGRYNKLYEERDKENYPWKDAWALVADPLASFLDGLADCLRNELTRKEFT
jgi:hypothetical protein